MYFYYILNNKGNFSFLFNTMYDFFISEFFAVFCILSENQGGNRIMEEIQGQQNKMGTEPILPLLISMSLPPISSMFMQYTYNFLDSMFVSWISEEALTSVSLAFPIITFIISVSIGLGVGSNVLIAKNLGKKDQNRADSIVSHSLILSSVVGILLTCLSFMVIEPYFRAFTDDMTIYRLGLNYSYIVVCMVLPNMLHISIQKIIQATGNMTAPMLFQMAGVALNFILDPILIFGRFGFPAMGVKGAAIATVLGYSFSTVLAFYVLIFRKQKVRIKIKNFYLDCKIFKNIFITGFPSLIMNILGAFMLIFANIFLTGFSMTAVAFFGMYYKIQQMIVMTVNGLIQGCLPLMSYNYGAKNTKRLMKSFKIGFIMALCMMSIGTVILWVFPANLLHLFKASDEMRTFGIEALKIMSLSFVFSAFGFMYASFFQATGRIRYSILINLLRQLIFLIPLMWLLSNRIGIIGVWWSFLISELLTTIVCLSLFYKGKAKEG